MDLREVTLHGHRLTYRTGGSGPVLLLIHGITNDSTTWDDVVPWLVEHYTVVAPDLLGHGRSAKPRTDYSLGAHANAMRDLLGLLAHERVTVVGHSLGGGVAMQFAYQFPERCERLVLVASGGLGREVHPLLRAAALPGTEWVLPWLCARGPRAAVRGAARIFGRMGLRVRRDLEEMWHGYVSLADADARQAFIHTVRNVIDVTGQRVSAANRLYLAASLPTLLVWGMRDSIIPVRHAHAAHRLIHGSWLELFPKAGHFPHREDPVRFVAVLRNFLHETAPARIDEQQWRALL